MKTVAMVAAVVVLSGCASTRLTQREGCWVRETRSFPGQVKEELGPCARAAPQWAEDRMARLVQECMVQADHRWQNRALAAWSNGEPLPAQESEDAVARECLAQAASPTIAENEQLKTRLAEVTQDRDTVKAVAAEDRAYIRQSHEQVATALGEAAKKPAPSAIATATSNGTATTTSDLQAQPSPATVVTPQVIQPVVQPVPTAAPACEHAIKPVTAERSKPRRRAAEGGAGKACDLKAKPAAEDAETKVAAALEGAQKPQDPATAAPASGQ